MPRTASLKIGTVLDKGLTRERNEDYLRHDRIAGAWLLTVSDGMGGHQNGQLASRTAGEALVAEIINDRFIIGGVMIDDLEVITSRLQRAFKEANDAVYEKSMLVIDHNDRRSPMGATLLSAVVLAGGDIVVGWVGDSRAYIVTQEGLQPLHFPHNITGMNLRNGTIDQSEEDRYKSSPGSSILLRSIGAEPTKYDDAPAEFVRSKLGPDDRLLLCSDGAWGEMTNAEIHAAVADADTVQAAASAVLAQAYEHGAKDNISVIVAQLEQR